MKVTVFVSFVTLLLLAAQKGFVVSFVFEESEEVKESPEGEEFHTKQRNCWNKGQLYWNETDQCYWPASRGPCGSSDEWIVLTGDPSVASNVNCRKRPCRTDEAFIKDRCSPITDRNVCTDTQVLVNNPFGFGYCACKERHVLWPSHKATEDDETPHEKSNGDGVCYALFRQGPCKEGEYLVIDVNDSKPMCSPNSCRLDGQVPYNNSCYPLGGKVACDNLFDGILTVDLVSFKLACYNPDLSLRQVAFVGYHCGSKSPMRHTSYCRPAWKIG